MNYEIIVEHKIAMQRFRHNIMRSVQIFKLHTHCLFNGVVGLVTLALWECTGLEDPHRPLRVETLLHVGGEGEQPSANKVTPAYRVRQKAIVQIHFVEGGLLTLVSVA